MTLTIQLPDSVEELATGWSKEVLEQVAVEAVVRHLLHDGTDDGPIGEFGPVMEEIPLDEATIAALKEARADYDAGRFYTEEQVEAHLDALFAAHKQGRDTK